MDLLDIGAPASPSAIPPSKYVTASIAAASAVGLALVLTFGFIDSADAQYVGPKTGIVDQTGSQVFTTANPAKVNCVSGCSGSGGGSGTISQIGTVTLTNTMPVSGTVSILGGGSNAAAGTTGAAVPGSAGYTGFSNSGTLVGVSSANPMPVTTIGSVTLTGSLPSGSNTLGAVSIAGTPSVLSAGGTLAVSSVGGTVTTAPTGTQTVGGTVAVSSVGGTVTTTPSASGTQAAINPDVRATGSIAAGTLNAAYTVALANGETTTGFTVVGLASSGATLTIEGSNDGGTTWDAVNVVSGGTGILSTTRSTDGNFGVASAGRTAVRLRVSTIGTGTITVASSASVGSRDAALSAPLPPGSNTIGAVSVTGTPSINIASGTATITGTTTLGVPTETYSSTQTLAVGSTSGTLFAAGAFVGATQLSNPSSCAGTIYINMHGGTAIVGGGAPIPPGGYYVFGTPSQPLPSGIAPTAISSSGSCTLAVSGG